MIHAIIEITPVRIKYPSGKGEGLQERSYTERVLVYKNRLCCTHSTDAPGNKPATEEAIFYALIAILSEGNYRHEKNDDP